MKKLIGFAVVLFSVVSVFASEWNSAIYDNIVNDISIVGNKVYTATNAGVEVFSKDGTNLPGESTPWKVFNTLSSGLPRNNVKSIATIDMAGNFYVAGDNWLAYKVGTLWQEVSVQSVKEIKIGPDGIKWAIMSINNVRGLYRDGGMGWEYIPMPTEIPLQDLSAGTSRLAIGSRGQGMDSAFNTIWVTCPTGITCYQGISGKGKVWQVGKELVAGAPRCITTRNDTVIVPAKNGVYAKYGQADWVVYAWPVFNGSDTMFSQSPINVVVMSVGEIVLSLKKDLLLLNPAGGGLGFLSINNPQVFAGVSVINCLAADSGKLYIGTDDHAWACDDDISGVKLRKISVTGIHYPCGNDVSFITKIDKNANAYGGLILTSTPDGQTDGSYGYSADANAPQFTGSANTICGGAVTSLFVDKDGMMWTGFADGTLAKDGGLDHQWINLPPKSGDKFWLVGDSSKKLWLVTTDSSGKGNGVYSDAGQGTWANQLNAPANLLKEKILSVNSTGKRVWIATDSSLYSYDFFGNWTYRKLGYSPYRSVAGEWQSGLGLLDDEIGRVWVADGGYQGGASDVKYIDVNSSLFNGPSYWPYTNRKPTCIFVDDHLTTWVGTDSGVYYHKLMTPWQAVPLRTATGHTLADDYVNTIYVDSATNSVWFGTAGGLTVWHQPNSTSVRPAVKTGMKNLSLTSGQDVAYFDLTGRKINPNSIKGLARGQIVFCRVNGVTMKMNLNLNRLR